MQAVNGTSSLRELITFRVADQEYCVDVMNVREIRCWVQATSIPHAPPAMLGVINLRGLVLPIIDLSTRMGFPPSKPSSRHAIIIAEARCATVGLLVDSVSEIFSISRERVQPTPEIASPAAKEFVEGVIPGDGRMISVLCLDKIVDVGSMAA